MSAVRSDDRLGLKVERFFTRDGVHPYDELEWELRDAVIKNWRDGTISFEQRGVEFPASWSMNATTIVAQKYFRGQLGSPARERSVKQMVDRVADTITDWGVKDGYFFDEQSAEVFNHELKHLLVNQKAAFNSPVWFNVGVEDNPQASACFILSVEDTMSSILNWYTEEGLIFKGGSGSGINLSNIRSSKEQLSGGGQPSGPVSFMRGADASAGTIKCLHRDTPIVTEEGAKSIWAVRPGERVLTRHGLKPVTDVHDTGIRRVVRVLTALGDEIVCTPEHPFWVRGLDGEGWREAGDLRPDDHLIMDLDACAPGTVQSLVPVEQGHHNELAHELPSTLDDPFALWLGWILGDGSITRRHSAKFVAVQVGDGDPELAGRYVSLTRSLFGEALNVYTSSHKDRSDASVSVRFASTRIIRFLARNGLLKSSRDLRVPGLVWSSPAQVRAAFLSGLFEADGHVSNVYPWLSTVSEALARDVHRLLLSLGIPSIISRIDDRRTALGTKPMHRVRVVSGEGVRRFAKLVGFVSERKSSLLQRAVARKNASPYETQWFLPHVACEVDAIWRSTSDQRFRRALAPYARYARPRRMSLLRARRLVSQFPEELGQSTLAAFAEGRNFYVTATVEAAGEAPTFDLTVRDVHEYLVHNVVVHNSGGKTRRAAKMVVLNADHPDIEEFIWCKAREERKTRVLREAGFDMDLDSPDYASIQYQNANNSVRVTDEFIQAWERDEEYDLRAVTTGEVLERKSARDVMRQIAQAAWECADPGMQYDTTINHWHTCPESGRINASNPCSEYMHLDNSACNLASLNLKKFYDYEADRFDVEAYKRAIEIVITAQEIIVGNSSYPTEKIRDNAVAYRELGLGYANLGGLLMSLGLAYDSDQGRAWCGALTALMTGHAYRTSAEIAKVAGPFSGYGRNAGAMLNVIRMHGDEAEKIDPRPVPGELLGAAKQAWKEAYELGSQYGFRNSQATVLAPTGTISFLMDCDTTGIEPDLGLVKTKKLVGGGSMSIVNQSVPQALRRLGYNEEQVEAVVAYIDERKTVIGAPALRHEHLPVFSCAMGDNPIHYMGHVKMMAGAQPFVSGAISKTVNMPEEATVEEVERLFYDAWKLGLKAIAIYRDNCKVAQPLAIAKGDKATLSGTGGAVEITAGMVRRKLPKQRPSQTISFRVADAEGYLTCGEYPGDGLGEIFMKLGKQGSTLSGVMDAFAISVSLGLQYGVPLEAYVSKFMNMRFEPAGMTDDEEIRFATSIVDYIARKLAIEYLPPDKRAGLGIYTPEERQVALDTDQPRYASPPSEIPDPTLPASGFVAASLPADADAPLCYACGIRMKRAGSCHVCEQCGTTSGCS
ncbi:MAG: vitamin B12-dependent ribonucleotide reductase [Nitriliruptorales bacterium]